MAATICPHLLQRAQWDPIALRVQVDGLKAAARHLLRLFHLHNKPVYLNAAVANTRLACRYSAALRAVGQ